MKGVNVRKIAALAAGTLMLGASVAIADVVYGNVQLVDQNGQPVVKVVVGASAMASDGVAAANIAAAIANKAYKSSTLTASVVGKATCTTTGSGSGAGTCAVTNKKATLDVTVPGVIGGAFQFSTLVNDYVDRSLGNRVKTNSEDLYTGTRTTSDQQDDINPLRFTSSAVQAVYKVDGTLFSPLGTVSVQDPKAAKTYTEEQAVYIGANGIYKRLSAGPVARYSAIAYQARFTNDDYGIAYCTASATTNDSACQSSDQTRNHRVPVEFLGSEWRISDMQVPGTMNTTYNLYPINGGTVKLAKESAYKIVNIGESIDAGEVQVKLSDISVATGAGNDHYAIVDILDANGAVLTQQQILPGSTYTYTTPSGASTRIHVYQTSPGFTLNAKWAEMAVYSDELTLTDGQKVDDNNKDWKVVLLWKNRDTSLNGVSALREIIVYTDASNIVNTDFAKGDSVTIVKDPALFSINFDGIDLGDADYDTLTFTVDNNANPLTIANKASGIEQCTTTNTSSATLVRVTTGVSNGFSVGAAVSDGASGLSGTYSSDTMYYDVSNGAVYVKPTSDANCYYNGVQGGNSSAYIQYKTVGSIGNKASGGVIKVTPTNTSTVVGAQFTIYEDAGRFNSTADANDSMSFSANLTSGSWTFKPTTSSTGQVIFTDANPGSAAHSEEAPFMSDRGSLFTSESTDTVQFSMAKKLGHLQWTISTSGTNVSDASEFTLGEGESKDLTGGIKVTLKSISETVGSCTATGSGAPTCDVDQTPVSAVILPDNAASVEVSQPYALTSKLVMLDSDASTSGTLITVGGPAVNTVTADALAGSSVDFTTTNVVVQAIGNKIVVAGLTAADTMTAADNFISQIKRQ